MAETRGDRAGLAVLGYRQSREGSVEGAGAKPDTGAGLSVRVVVYSKPGCHLCEIAEPVVADVCAELSVEWESVDISTDETLMACLLYTSDAADDLTRVDLGGRRIIKK